MFSAQEYLHALQLTKQQVPLNLPGLITLQQAHFYQIPFGNLAMHQHEPHQLAADYLFEQLIIQRHGGICYEFCAVIAPLLTQLGFSHRTRMARVYQPKPSSKTHQVLIVTLAGQDWLLDIGFGAKGPRKPLLLQAGYTDEHPFLTSQIRKSSEEGWLVYAKEKRDLRNKWQLLYSFHDIPVITADILMAYFYIVHSPKSPFTQHEIVSLPTQQGRISLRDHLFTEVIKGQAVDKRILTTEQREVVLRERFAMR